MWGHYVKKDTSNSQIAKTLSVHPYRVKLMMENRSLPNEGRLLTDFR